MVIYLDHYFSKLSNSVIVPDEHRIKDGKRKLEKRQKASNVWWLMNHQHKHTLQIKDKCALGLICYETNSYNAINYQGHEPNFIIDITNDAWYGYSTGPFQHFQQDRILTTMTQLPRVRISNNGISAVIDSYGRIKRKADLNKTANIISFLPN